VPGVKPLARGQVRTCLAMTSREDRPLPRAPVVRGARGQAVKHAEGSCCPSCRGIRRPPSTPSGCTVCPVETHIARHAGEQRKDNPVIIYRTSRDRTQGGGKSGSRRSLYFSLSLSRLSDPYPLAYKREGEDPRRGMDFGDNTNSPTQHFATRDLGARSLSRLFVTPTAN
jgi:hypothetical protein